MTAPQSTTIPTSVEYRAVPGYSGYSVTTNGRMRGPRGELTPMPAHRGHLYILTRRPGVPKKLYVHKAILLAFVGPCPDGMQARHLNDIANDNRLENLLWGTPLENSADKIRNGRQRRGEQMPQAKLTPGDVADVRKRWPGETLRALASEYGVSHTAIRRAVHGIKWGHI